MRIVRARPTDTYRPMLADPREKWALAITDDNCGPDILLCLESDPVGVELCPGGWIVDVLADIPEQIRLNANDLVLSGYAQ